MQLVPIITHGKVYPIQYYMIKFVNYLRQVCFFPGTPVSSTNKTDCHDKAEILFKVVLNTVNPITPWSPLAIFLVWTFHKFAKKMFCSNFFLFDKKSVLVYVFSYFFLFERSGLIVKLELCPHLCQNRK